MTHRYPNLSTDPRAAGMVKRFHAWPLMLREQSVGEHSWQVVRIALAIHPQASRDLVVECLMHDVGEIWAGDTPSHAKRNQILREQHDKEEERSRSGMVLPWIVPAAKRLSDLESFVLKLADMIELWETATQELYMGNQFAGKIQQSVSEAIERHCESYSKRYLDCHEDLTLLVSVTNRASAYIARRYKEWTSEQQSTGESAPES